MVAVGLPSHRTAIRFPLPVCRTELRKLPNGPSTLEFLPLVAVVSALVQVAIACAMGCDYAESSLAIDVHYRCHLLPLGVFPDAICTRLVKILLRVCSRAATRKWCYSFKTLHPT
ncbi:hypothetical protein BT96DRAFT_84489 [Gymnopus androsaceus JB14]|uniref:Uncharacterized protein n=1 Tax=Gymnopus androsaceus JB14 TaxID=1447944 RepID=A0A6A4IB56_9AGAR|nr:hypothetical protein BT96DRAFT_84489 [Gymnopus androsaceus JB14]